MINYKDFHYVRQGRQVGLLAPKDGFLLKAFDHRGQGTKRALVLLHGFSSSPAVFRYLIPELRSYDALVCPVLPGHAESISAFSQSKAQEWLSTAYQTTQQLLDEYQQVDVLGLSLGGLIACKLSQELPLNHLYLLAPALKLKANLKFLLKLAQALQYLGCSQIRNAAGNLLHLEHAEIAYRILPLASIIEILQLIQDYQWIAPSCPIDLFLGASDQIVSSSKIAALFEPLPNASIHWLKNSAHVLPLDNDYQEIAACLNQI